MLLWLLALRRQTNVSHGLALSLLIVLTHGRHSYKEKQYKISIVVNFNEKHLYYLLHIWPLCWLQRWMLHGTVVI